MSRFQILAESSTDDEDEAPPTDLVIVESPSRIVVGTVPINYVTNRLIYGEW